MLGFGMAVSILVGQRIGEKRPDLAEKSVYSGFHLTFAYMFSMALAYITIPKSLFWLFIINADQANLIPIRDLAVILLRFVAIFSLFDTMYVIFSSGVRGAGDTKFTMYMVAILSMLTLALPTYIALGILNLELFTAWTILTAYISLMGFAFLLRFRGGRWKSMQVIEPRVVEG
jgi:MATE family multidrug resistance protein